MIGKRKCNKVRYETGKGELDSRLIKVNGQVGILSKG